MTALNVVQMTGKVIIMTDGANYDREGKLHGLTMKCRDVPARTMAIATSGSVKLIRDMLILLPRAFRNIDELARGGGLPFFQRYMDDQREFLARVGRPGGLFVVAGWSEVVQSPIYVAYQEDTRDPAKTWFRISPSFVRMPNTLGLPPIHRSSFDPHTDGLAMMEQQRRDASDGVHLVGGHVQLTEITREGITHEIIHIWDQDAIGERIRPEPFGRTEQSRQVGDSAADR